MQTPQPPAAARCADRERGDVILGWLTKLVVVMGIAGIAIFEAVSVGVTTTTLADQGTSAAREASETWQETKNVQQAYDAALAFALEANARNTIDTETFVIDEDNTVHLTVSREATTLLLYRWDRTERWAQLEREVAGRSIA